MAGVTKVLSLALLRRRAVRQGFLGGSAAWSLLGVLLFAPRVWRMLFGRKPETITLGPLAPGEQISIRAVRRG